MDLDHEGEESDGLVHSSFVIACTTPSSRIRTADDALRDAFPILSKYERTAGPSKLRKSGYKRASKGVRQAFESTISSIYDSMMNEIEGFCNQQQYDELPFFIPGSSKDTSSPRRLSSAAFVGPQLSRCFDDRLDKLFGKQKDKHLVTLRPRECPSLASMTRLTVARLTAQSTSFERETGNLSHLSTLSSSSTVVINVPSIALQRYAALNDFIKALHASIQDPKFPRLLLLFGSEAGSATLDEKLDSESLRLLDIKRFTFPPPTAAFDKMIQELFLDEDHGVDVWLGPSTLERLRQQYFEGDFDLDKVVSTIEILESDAEDNVSLPRPSSAAGPSSKREYLLKLLTDEDALLTGMADFARAIKHRRSDIRRATHLLHSLRSTFLIQSNNDEDEAITGPKRTSLGGLAFYILSEKSIRPLIAGVNTALRRASIAQVDAFLSEIKDCQWAAEGTFQADLTSYQDRLHVEIQKEREEATCDIDALSRSERVEMVQRKLLREESSDAIKRSLIEVFTSLLQLWTSGSPLLNNVWSYDYSSYIDTLLEPSPRISILSALHDPSSNVDIDGSEVPDICQLYQMYQSAGKMINLADWHRAFSQSVVSSCTSKTKKKRSQEDDGEEESEKFGIADRAMVKREVIQARFALAICEMGKMGFLKKTRRKADHVLKVVHDLSPSV
ncbi:hypothetical protein CBS101457_006016 [Exobasidium rhododendri]|nr:hypothetical protein CBS101457_006016 [Exobasidium rhododendri]